jgi:hypothetical protein
MNPDFCDHAFEKNVGLYDSEVAYCKKCGVAPTQRTTVRTSGDREWTDHLAHVGIFGPAIEPPPLAWNDPAPDDGQSDLDRAYEDDAK